MTINTIDGAYQLCLWRDAARIAEQADAAEYSDYAMELKQRVHTLFRSGEFTYAALFQWNAGAADWELVEEMARRGDARPVAP